MVLRLSGSLLCRTLCYGSKGVLSSSLTTVIRGSSWMQVAGLKNYAVPPNYDDIVIPTDRQRLRVLQKVPQYHGGTRPPKMTKRLDLIRGEEEVHRDLLLGQYGIVAKRGGMLRHGHIEMIRMSVARKMNTSKMYAIWRIDAPWKPITRRGQGKRMGGGKGAIDHYVTPIKAERIIMEVAGKCSFEEAKPFLKMIAHILPFPAVAVSKETLEASRKETRRLEEEDINPYTFKYLIQNNMLGCHKWIREIDRTYWGKYH